MTITRIKEDPNCPACYYNCPDERCSCTYKCEDCAKVYRPNLTGHGFSECFATVKAQRDRARRALNMIRRNNAQNKKNSPTVRIS